jgi:hypothetical protein
LLISYTLLLNIQEYCWQILPSSTILPVTLLLPRTGIQLFLKIILLKLTINLYVISHKYSFQVYITTSKTFSIRQQHNLLCSSMFVLALCDCVLPPHETCFKLLQLLQHNSIFFKYTCCSFIHSFIHSFSIHPIQV